MVLFCSILSNREERSLLEKDISKTKILLIALMRDVVSLYLLVGLRNSVFLSYSPNRAVSFMSMARTALAPLTQYIAYDEDRKWSTSLSLFRIEKTGTNGHMSCCSQTHTTSSDPSHPQDNLRLCAMGIMLQRPRTLTKKTLGDRAFLAAAPKLWNGLPSQIRNEPNFHRFKGLLKTHFFRLAFY